MQEPILIDTFTSLSIIKKRTVFIFTNKILSVILAPNHKKLQFMNNLHLARRINKKVKKKIITFWNNSSDQTKSFSRPSPFYSLKKPKVRVYWHRLLSNQLNWIVLENRIEFIRNVRLLTYPWPLCRSFEWAERVTRSYWRNKRVRNFNGDK